MKTKRVDITEIKQSLSTLVCEYLECAVCGIVDNDLGRDHVSQACSSCGSAGTARLNFNINIHILAEVIPEAYHAGRVPDQDVFNDVIDLRNRLFNTQSGETSGFVNE